MHNPLHTSTTTTTTTAYPESQGVNVLREFRARGPLIGQGTAGGMLSSAACRDFPDREASSAANLFQDSRWTWYILILRASDASGRKIIIMVILE